MLSAVIVLRLMNMIPVMSANCDRCKKSKTKPKCAICPYFAIIEMNDYTCDGYDFPIKFVTYRCTLYGDKITRRYKMNKSGIVTEELPRENG